MAEKETPEGAHGFSVLLGSLSSGYCHAECTEELNKLLKDLRVAADLRGPKGKAKGSLTLKLEIEVGAGGTARIVYDVTKKAPKRDREEDSFWLTRNSNLTRKNPKQQELPLRDVSAKDRQADAEDGATVSQL